MPVAAAEADSVASEAAEQTADERLREAYHRLEAWKAAHEYYQPRAPEPDGDPAFQQGWSDAEAAELTELRRALDAAVAAAYLPPGRSAEAG